MSALDGALNAPRDCQHDWKPISFVFETQSLDSRGRVLVRQPDLDEARVYLVCLECASHTYISTSWIGYRLHGSQDANPRFITAPDGENVMPNPNYQSGHLRAGFEPTEKREEA